MAPEHLARQQGTRDPRVQFKPDVWQVQLLDIADAGQSSLVLAPTASGKTFISFYIMEQVLRSGSDGVVVYVCPTKPLANQVYAEIGARFEKEYKSSDMTTHGIFTRDQRDHGMECQILVTVPECLLIYLLTPTTASKAWVDRLRYAIVDEVHCLGDGNGKACVCSKIG